MVIFKKEIGKSEIVVIVVIFIIFIGMWANAYSRTNDEYNLNNELYFIQMKSNIDMQKALPKKLMELNASELNKRNKDFHFSIAKKENSILNFSDILLSILLSLIVLL